MHARVRQPLQLYGSQSCARQRDTLGLHSSWQDIPNTGRQCQWCRNSEILKTLTTRTILYPNLLRMSIQHSEKDAFRMMPISPQKHQVPRQWPMMGQNTKTSLAHSHIPVTYSEASLQNESENASHATNGPIKKKYRWIKVHKMAKDHKIKSMKQNWLQATCNW